GWVVRHHFCERQGMEHRVKIFAITQDTHETLKFAVEKPEGFRFEPGQATSVALNQPGAQKDKHPFTFTSLPEDPCLQFTVKTYPQRDGMTDAMRDLKVGDELILEDAWGAISYKGPGLFLAAGAGITPFLSIFRKLHQSGDLEHQHLLYANRHQKDIIAAAELKTIFGPRVHFFLSEDVVPFYQQGRVDAAVLRGFLETIQPGYCYVCGPPKFDQDMVRDLKELGIDEKFIVKESF
ncbi:MAG: hypothetical protein ACQKBU_05505, partial [Verrucomicrobiales bacterium]